MSADTAPVASPDPRHPRRTAVLDPVGQPARTGVRRLDRALVGCRIESSTCASYLLPPPQDVLPRLYTSRQSLWNHSLVTLQEIIMGFGLSVVTAIPMGLLIALSPAAKRMLYPFLMFIQLVPKIAIAPLFVVWVGFGMTSKVLLDFAADFLPAAARKHRRLSDPRSAPALSDAIDRRHVLADLPLPAFSRGAAGHLRRPEDLGHHRRDGGHRGGVRRRQQGPRLPAAAGDGNAGYDLCVRHSFSADHHRSRPQFALSS